MRRCGCEEDLVMKVGSRVFVEAVSESAGVRPRRWFGIEVSMQVQRCGANSICAWLRGVFI